MWYEKNQVGLFQPASWIINAMLHYISEFLLETNVEKVESKKKK